MMPKDRRPQNAGYQPVATRVVAVVVLHIRRFYVIPDIFGIVKSAPTIMTWRTCARGNPNFVPKPFACRIPLRLLDLIESCMGVAGQIERSGHQIDKPALSPIHVPGGRSPGFGSRDAPSRNWRVVQGPDHGKELWTGILWVWLADIHWKGKDHRMLYHEGINIIWNSTSTGWP